MQLTDIANLKRYIRANNVLADVYSDNYYSSCSMIVDSTTDMIVVMNTKEKLILPIRHQELEESTIKDCGIILPNGYGVFIVYANGTRTNLNIALLDTSKPVY